MEKIMTHFGHDHPLTFFEEEGDDDYNKPNSICSMCNLPILSIPSYVCTLPTCADFFLHQPCALLPKTFQNPLHPEKQYTLISLPPNDEAQCRKCRKAIQNFAYRYRRVYIIHPMCAKAVEIKMKHKSHPQHPLIAIHKEMSSECDACGEEHKGIFFSCVECSFLIHKDCASSPSVVKLVSHKHPLILTYDFYDLYALRYRFPDCDSCGKVLFGQGLYFCARCTSKFHMKCVSKSSDVQILDSELSIREPPGNSKYFFCSMFLCFRCGRPSNGFGCSIAKMHSDSNVCVECAFSPQTATHESHHGGVGQHILFQTPRRFKSSKPASCCSSALIDNSVMGYSCVSCEFRIHIGCAQLPKKVSHRDFHKHPLELVFTNDEKSFKKIQDCFCEFCEEDIDQRYWFYRCAECDQSFHVKCIPSVGLLSNVKFGGRLNIPNHPRHPVILTRMLMEGNQRCDYNYCRKIINGYVDDMAFRCDECDFWIHFKCARDCSTTAQRDRDKPWLWDYAFS